LHHTKERKASAKARMTHPCYQSVPKTRLINSSKSYCECEDFRGPIALAWLVKSVGDRLHRPTGLVRNPSNRRKCCDMSREQPSSADSIQCHKICARNVTRFLQLCGPRLTGMILTRAERTIDTMPNGAKTHRRIGKTTLCGTHRHQKMEI
jgi:hypothetical protein